MITSTIFFIGSVWFGSMQMAHSRSVVQDTTTIEQCRALAIQTLDTWKFHGNINEYTLRCVTINADGKAMIETVGEKR